MSVIKIKEHLEKVGKNMIERGDLLVNFLHGNNTHQISIFFSSSRQDLFYHISDAVPGFKEKYIIESPYNFAEKPPYNCGDDGMDIFIQVLEKIISKYMEIYSITDDLSIDSIKTKLRKKKIKTILNNEK